MTSSLSTRLTPKELEERLRAIGAERYHNRHPFHRKLHDGLLNKQQVQAWALNRYYYQASIPAKDATLLARLPTTELRREWRRRIEDHDGTEPGTGGVARWLVLTDGLGLDRAYVESLKGLLPATRFSVEAYIHFVRDRSILEAIASSLTELFSPTIISERVSGMLQHYDFISKDTLAYFTPRLTQAPRDSDFALGYVLEHAKTIEQQEAVLAALEFKCSVLWTMLDALDHAYVHNNIPPGAFIP
ncbi:pyrroloquinoline quinone biosynthesis protein PqqC [Neokomagataea thailandica NBRC 106555]|uniref:Pyrroloquinoline-quinone synthase n=2 Tax=Neokomagataea TaxID=1223423 RepID=A0A4Y6V857_9PROT|nr:MULTISPECIES: pyrroloquinoline-quinone synthase PqqC [Neokomagataea]QDH24657.1 pyrroloquinoline quinone biosynthesis protein PqqC [Neokomagataea tanensis]GBR53920.1 pyrroloquinoline quinone biosynthesis protein PqqC [Neokomagataea thailandica NBRC 106555]